MVTVSGGTAERMRYAVEVVGQVTGRARAELAELREQLEPLAENWRGRTATAFWEAVAGWDAAAAVLDEALISLYSVIAGRDDLFTGREATPSASPGHRAPPAAQTAGKRRSGIMVNFVELAAAEHNVASAAHRLNIDLADVHQHLAPWMGTWTGQLAEEYRHRQRQWDDQLVALTAHLGGLATALCNVNELHQRGERQCIMLWR